MAVAPVAARSSPASGLRLALASTPGRIAGGFALIVVLLALAAAANLGAASSAGEAIQTIGSDAEPSVVAALRIGAMLSNLDATAADDGLNGGLSAAGTSTRWREGKAALDALLVQASRNITYPAETAAIQDLLRWTGEYHAALAEARAAADPAQPFVATQRLQWSHRLLSGFALPAAESLAAANRKPLEDDYVRYRDAGSVVGGVATILAVVAALVGVQVFLARRTRRVLNLPLAAATLLALALALGVAVVTGQERFSVRIAKEDCYASLDPLYAAKGTAAALDAQLALWLLDPAGRSAAAGAFGTEALRMLSVPQRDGTPSLQWRDGAAMRRLTQALARAQDLERQAKPGDAKDAAPKLGGFLGTELGNVTFGPAERDPATDAIRALLDYLSVADEARALGAMAGKMREATMLRDTAGRDALGRLNAALDAAIAVNQREFDAHVAEARRLVALTPAVVCAGLALAGLLAATGAWQRYREYA